MPNSDIIFQEDIKVTGDATVAVLFLTLSEYSWEFRIFLFTHNSKKKETDRRHFNSLLDYSKDVCEDKDSSAVYTNDSSDISCIKQNLRLWVCR